MSYIHLKDAKKRATEKAKADPSKTYLVIYDPYDEIGDENKTPYYVASEDWYYTPENEGGPVYSGSESIVFSYRAKGE